MQVVCLLMVIINTKAGYLLQEYPLQGKVMTSSRTDIVVDFSQNQGKYSDVDTDFSLPVEVSKAKCSVLKK